MSSRYKLIVDIFEGDRLVVTHIFWGDTPAECEHVHQAHRHADAFLRQCEDKGVYVRPGGNVGCSVRIGKPVRDG